MGFETLDSFNVDVTRLWNLTCLSLLASQTAGDGYVARFNTQSGGPTPVVGVFHRRVTESGGLRGKSAKRQNRVPDSQAVEDWTSVATSLLLLHAQMTHTQRLVELIRGPWTAQDEPEPLTAC